MGRSPCCQKEGLKKGPWLPEEDEKLIAYVKEHGHGNWRALPKKCGLLRCGKSCRLRWTNYLRPDIKRGLFSHSEEQKIIMLHALVGNKWAFIASQLPKRTDNEIKNYWNTVLRKRLQEQGLLISMPTRTVSPSAVAGAQGSKHIKGSASRFSSSNSTSPNGMQGKSRSHLAQWESARLEAEARLAKESQSRLLSLKSGFAAASTRLPPPPPPPPASTTTTTASAFSLNSGFVSSTQPLPPPASTTTTATASAFASFNNTHPTHHVYPCSIAHLLSTTHSASANPPFTLSSTSRNSYSSQKICTASALTLGPNGRLSWKTQDLAFTSSPLPQEANIDKKAKFDMDQQTQCKAAGHGPTKKDMELQHQKAGWGDNTMLGFNSMISLPSADNWQDLLFAVENSCSDVVSTWRSQEIEPIGNSQIGLENTATSLISTNTDDKSCRLECAPPIADARHVQGESHSRPSHHHGLESLNACMDLDDLSSLCHLDSLLCEQINQHSNVPLGNTPTRLSINWTSSVSGLTK